MTLAAEQDAAVRAIVASMLKQALGGADSRIRTEMPSSCDRTPNEARCSTLDPEQRLRLHCLHLAARLDLRGHSVRDAAAWLADFVLTGVKTELCHPGQAASPTADLQGGV